ncbi:MAG: DNA-directed DNA polymerase I [Thaumarchaeota archaeon]|nr:DNA-directed DNA polymerase I [Nitrososphaerota archaeon]
MQVNVTEIEKIESMPPSMLVSAAYDNISKSAVLKFYEPKSQKLILWKDETGHKPYCYSRLAPEELDFLRERDDVLEIKTVQRYDLLKDKEIDMSKIIVADPLAIGGTAGDKSIRNIIETWESDIKYYETYLYDRKLIVGKYYEIKDGKLDQKAVELEIPTEVKIALKSLLWDKVDSESMVDPEQFKKFILEWADLLNQPIPKIKRLSVDIEVESVIGRIPDPKVAEKKVTAIGFKGSNGFDKIFVLKTEGTEEGTNELDQSIKIVFYDLDKEKEMIQDAFDIIKEFPFVITYNGDEFDLPYLYNRAERLGIKNSMNPLYMMRNSATLKKGVHLDLYRTFSNRAFQIYVFSQKYTNFSLNSVSKALIGKEKIDYGLEFDQLTLYQTANYCYNDALLTYELTSFNNDLLMNMLVIIARIGRMPIDDVARMGVSQWIRSLFYYEHRKRNYLIPKREELERRSEGVLSDAVIKDKKFRGGLVIDPKEGIHFDVVVMDFASLYPSIIKVRNISYETVRCPHEDCKRNTIPQTNHWTCSKKNGLASMIIGSLRDLRVNYYKSLSKKESLTDEQRQQYSVISQALKVILNASYGVMGAEIFPLYFLPAAEATTAIGRHTILETIKKCEEIGIEVLYGDTDSLFIKKPTEEQIQQVIEQAKKDHGVDLEVDKTYRYCVLSKRKKNYLGVTKDGKVDVKGLTGKKSHTPPFIKKLFYDLLDVLSKVQTMDDFKNAKKEISEKIAICSKKLQAKEIPLEDLTFNVMLSKAISEYTKTIPQHIRAAKQLESIREVKKGDIISYIKILNKPGVKPVEMAKKEEIDSKKYMEFLESTLEQITSSMDLDFDTILGKPKQTGLDEFFWS